MPTISADMRREEVLHLWKQIDRSLSRVTNDTEISGIPNKSLTSDDFTPLELDDKYTILGALKANDLAYLQTRWDQDQIDKLKRYEMLKTAQEHPEIDGSLNIYADESTTEDMDGRIIHVSHPKQEVKDIVEEMYERIGMEEKSWHIIRNTCGFGDEFYEVVVSKTGKSILKLNRLPREAIERIEENNILVGFRINQQKLDELNNNFTYQLSYATKKEDEQELIYPFRVLHFKIPSDKYGVYGQSIIDSVVGTINQLKLLEKSLVIARVTRAPERRVFTVDVGQLQGEKAIKYANQVVENFKGKKKIRFYDDGKSGTDLQKDIFGTVEDIVIPKRAGSEGNSITTLEQASGLGDIQDIEFLRDKIFPAIGIPRQYFFDDTFANANTNLSSKSVQFAKKIKRVQRFFLTQLYKLAIIELKLKGYSNDDISQLTISMNNPSTIDDREKIDLETQRWGLIGAIKGLNSEKVFFPDYLLYQDILKYDKEEIVMLLKLAKLQEQGVNPFGAFDIDERPEGAEDLESIGGSPTGGEVGGGGDFGMGGSPMGGMGGEAGGEDMGGATGGEVDIPQEVKDQLGEPPEEGEETEAPEQTPENAGFVDNSLIGRRNYLEEKKRQALAKKQMLINKVKTDMAEVKDFFENRQFNQSEKNQLDNNYGYLMKKAKRVALSEMYINGQLGGIDSLNDNIRIYDETIREEDCEVFDETAALQKIYQEEVLDKE